MRIPAFPIGCMQGPPFNCNVINPLKINGNTHPSSLSPISVRRYMGYSLNSLKGGYIGDYIGDYYRGY